MEKACERAAPFVEQERGRDAALRRYLFSGPRVSRPAACGNREKAWASLSAFGRAKPLRLGRAALR